MPLLGGEKSSGPSHDGEGWQGTIIPLSAMEGGGGGSGPGIACKS